MQAQYVHRCLNMSGRIIHQATWQHALQLPYLDLSIHDPQTTT